MPASIPTPCPPCGVVYPVNIKYAGARIQCPKCGGGLTVPASASADNSPPNTATFGDFLDLVPQSRCPQCNASMASDAVLCLQCGYNVRTKQKFSAGPDSPSPRGLDIDPQERRRQHQARFRVMGDDGQSQNWAALVGGLAVLGLVILGAVLAFQEIAGSRSSDTAELDDTQRRQAHSESQNLSAGPLVPGSEPSPTPPDRHPPPPIPEDDNPGDSTGQTASPPQAATSAPQRPPQSGGLPDFLARCQPLPLDARPQADDGTARDAQLPQWIQRLSQTGASAAETLTTDRLTAGQAIWLDAFRAANSPESPGYSEAQHAIAWAILWQAQLANPGIDALDVVWAASHRALAAGCGDPLVQWIYLRASAQLCWPVSPDIRAALARGVAAAIKANTAYGPWITCETSTVALAESVETFGAQPAELGQMLETAMASFGPAVVVSGDPAGDTTRWAGRLAVAARKLSGGGRVPDDINIRLAAQLRMAIVGRIEARSARQQWPFGPPLISSTNAAKVSTPQGLAAPMPTAEDNSPRYAARGPIGPFQKRPMPGPALEGLCRGWLSLADLQSQISAYGLIDGGPDRLEFTEHANWPNLIVAAEAGFNAAWEGGGADRHLGAAVAVAQIQLASAALTALRVGVTDKRLPDPNTLGRRITYWTGEALLRQSGPELFTAVCQAVKASARYGKAAPLKLDLARRVLAQGPPTDGPSWTAAPLDLAQLIWFTARVGPDGQVQTTLDTKMFSAASATYRGEVRAPYMAYIAAHPGGRQRRSELAVLACWANDWPTAAEQFAYLGRAPRLAAFGNQPNEYKRLAAQADANARSRP